MAGLGQGVSVAGSLSGLVPRPKTSHPYVLGLILTTVGIFALVGSITGTLPSMIAALFVPQALEDAGSTPVSPGSFDNILGGANGVVAGIVDPAYGLSQLFAGKIP